MRKPSHDPHIMNWVNRYLPTRHSDLKLVIDDEESHTVWKAIFNYWWTVYLSLCKLDSCERNLSILLTQNVKVAMYPSNLFDPVLSSYGKKELQEGDLSFSWNLLYSVYCMDLGEMLLFSSMMQACHTGWRWSVNAGPSAVVAHRYLAPNLSKFKHEPSHEPLRSQRGTNNNQSKHLSRSLQWQPSSPDQNLFSKSKSKWK